jgi:ESCRT-I complex subunit VPS28
MEVPRATERIRIGLPSSVTAPAYSATTAAASGASGSLIAQAAEAFITFGDALKLGLLSKDQLHPLLSEIIQSVNKVTNQDFDNKGKIIQWLITLNQMRASDELSEDQARDLDLDINSAYNGFKSTLT